MTDRTSDIYKIIFDANPVPMWIYDPRTLDFLEVNTAAITNYGYTREEFLRMTIRDIRPPEDIARLEHILPSLADTVGRWEEWRHRRKDGVIIMVDIISHAITYRGRSARIVAAHEVTRRKEAEDRLKRDQELWSAYMDNIPDTIFFKDKTSRYTKVNSAQAHRLGAAGPEEMVGKTDAEYFSPGFAAKTLAEEQAIFASGASHISEDSVVLSDGLLHTFSTIKVPLKDPDGTVTGLVGSSRDITAQKRAEEELRESKLNYELLMNSVDGIVFEAEPFPGKFYYISAQAERILGYPVNAWLTDPQFWFKHTHPDDRVWTQSYGQNESQHGRSYELEYRMIRSDGSVIWIHEITTVIVERGTPVRLRGLMLDVTARKYAETEVQRLSEQRKYLLDISQSILAEVSLDIVIRKILDALKHVISYDSCGLYWLDEEQRFLRPYMIVHPDNISPALATWPIPYGRGIMSAVLINRRGEVVNNAHADPRSVYPEGSIIQTEHLISIPILAKDHPLGVMFVSRQSEIPFTRHEFEMVELFITHVAFAIAHARLFEQTKKSEERYRALFEESRDVVFISSPEGRFLDINPAGVDLFGYASREELLAVDVRRGLYANPDDRERYIQEIEQHGYVKDFEVSIRTRNGEIRTLVETATPVRDDQGRIVAYRGILRDVTQIKELQQRLVQAQKLESLGTLAGGIAHDFNNILAIIIAYVSRIERGKVEGENLAKSLETIKKASWRGAELVRQILTFARKTETISESIDLNFTLNEVVKMLTETLPRTVRFSLNLEPELPRIIADPNQIHQAIINLCVNARDAMPDGGTISIITRLIPASVVRKHFPETKNVHHIEVSIADTGTGMSEEIQARIFEPFFTTKEQGKGTGLGLAMVYGIMQNHNGFIDVESEPGKGTEFSLYLPIPAEAITRLEQTVSASEAPKGAHETLLVVEDEEMLREFIQSFLENQGYSVIAAGDGLQALNLYKNRRHEISLVFSDMGLPGLSGWESVKKMREVDDHVKVIFATGFLDPDIKTEILHAGIQHFVAKPYLPEEILKKIREVLDE